MGAFERRLQAVAESGHILAIFDHYKNPRYTQRVWCIFEVFKATQEGLKLEVLFPLQVYNEFRHELELGNIHHIAQSVKDIDVKSASASRKLDEQSIKRQIFETVGYA